jgi:DNA-binding Lrp family transcriptional regulator
MVTGDSYLTIRVVADNMKSFQDFLTTKIAALKGVELVSSNVITKIVKEEHGVILHPTLRLDLRCDYCHGKIQGQSFRLKVGERERYFCCRVCLESYKEKYGPKIEVLFKQDGSKM